MDSSWILTFLVGLLTWFLAKHYLKTRNLPPGPFPLPLVGNLLDFKKRTASDVLQEYRKKYGDLFTVWLGQVPFIFVCDLPRIKQSLMERRNDFSGRGNFQSTAIMLDGHTNIADSQFGKAWETLRKMGHAAIRKYAAADKLPPLVDQITQEMVNKMLEEKEPFDPKDHVYLLYSNIIASSLLGKKYANDDPEFLAFRGVAETFNQAFGEGFMGDFFPSVGFLFKTDEAKLRSSTQIGIGILLGKLKQHEATYEPGFIRDMMDSLISAREESIAEGKETAVHMNDMNMAYSAFDMYFAGVETSQIATKWILLFLATHQDIQKKVIQEIQDQIGDRIPVQEDKKFCPYTTAVIYETLRCRTSAPLGLPRSATCDSQIGDFRIPKGMTVIFYTDMVHNDATQWDQPELYKPERFLNADGKFTDARLNQFMSFGLGRRNCIGEKLAIVEIFMVLAGIFRKCKIELKEPPVDLNPIADNFFFHISKPYKIIAKPIS